MERPAPDESMPVLPTEMPVMVLPDCHLFPSCLLPLYLFEQRYLAMLQRVLSTNRMFCIGNRDGDDENAPISSHTTAGLVRACVQQEDGTSHLLLLGLKRVRIQGWIQEEPFRVARIETMETCINDKDDIPQLKAQVLGLFEHEAAETAIHLREALSKNDNLELVCDVLSYHFTRCPKLQQKLLEERDLGTRYRLLIDALERHKTG